MGESRIKAFIAVFILALLGGIFVYRKESASVTPFHSTGNSLVTGSKTDGSLPIVTDTSESSADKKTAELQSLYADANIPEHRPMTIENIIWFTNYERFKNGIAPLEENSTLDLSARLKTQDMITYQYFDHTRPGTQITFDRFFDNAHYSFIKAGENLAQGTFSSTEQLMNDWMNSVEHRRNILDPVYTQIGVDAQDASLQGFGTTIIVQHFGDPRKNCPTVDGGLDSDIKTLEDQAQELNRNISKAQTAVSNANSSSGNYQSLVDDYNNLVATYNQVIAEIRTIGNEYNAQVAAFNDCVSQ